MQVSNTSGSARNCSICLNILEFTRLAGKVDSIMLKGKSFWQFASKTQLGRVYIYVVEVTIPALKTGFNLDLLFSVISSVSRAVSSFFGHPIFDYQDPQQCLIMRKKAENLSFTEIIEKHGLSQLSQLQIPNIQEKFAQSYAKSTFEQIIKEHPLAEIEEFGLSPLTNEGFLHDKFLEMVRKNKLDFIKNWKPDPFICKIINESQVQYLIFVQHHFETLLQSLEISKNNDPNQNEHFLAGKRFALKMILENLEKESNTSFKILEQENAHRIGCSLDRLKEFNQEVVKIENDLEKIFQSASEESYLQSHPSFSVILASTWATVSAYQLYKHFR